jgi:hypothetical protein
MKKRFQNLKQVVSQLQFHRQTKEQELRNLDMAIKALLSSGGSDGTLIIRKKPHFSAAAKARIASAQRARWAKLNTAKNKVGP